MWWNLKIPCVWCVLWQDGGLAIPLHAYPVSGSPPLPKHLDLGQVPLGEAVTRQLQLHSSSGVPVDFSVGVLKHNKQFTVTPMSGTLPAHGSAAVAVTFTPTKYSTEHLQLQVQLGEIGADPMQVLLTGCCKPGLTQQKIVAAATAGGMVGSGEIAAGLLCHVVVCKSESGHMRPSGGEGTSLPPCVVL